MNHYLKYKLYKKIYKDLKKGGSLGDLPDDVKANLHKYLGSNELATTERNSLKYKLSRTHHRNNEYITACASIESVPYQGSVDFCPESKEVEYNNKRFKCCQGFSRDDVLEYFYKLNLMFMSTPGPKGEAIRKKYYNLVKLNGGNPEVFNIREYSRFLLETDDLYRIGLDRIFHNSQYISFGRMSAFLSKTISGRLDKNQLRDLHRRTYRSLNPTQNKMINSLFQDKLNKRRKDMQTANKKSAQYGDILQQIRTRNSSNVLR